MTFSSSSPKELDMQKSGRGGGTGCPYQMSLNGDYERPTICHVFLLRVMVMSEVTYWGQMSFEVNFGHFRSTC